MCRGPWPFPRPMPFQGHAADDWRSGVMAATGILGCIRGSERVGFQAKIIIGTFGDGNGAGFDFAWKRGQDRSAFKFPAFRPAGFGKGEYYVHPI